MLADPRMLEELDWFIHPVVNPDGFTFTHEHVSYIPGGTELDMIKVMFRRGCGGRPGQTTAPSSCVAEWTETGTTDITGTVRLFIARIS